MSSPAWLQRLGNSSLRKQYVASLWLVVAALLLATVVSAGAVIWAAVATRQHADQIVALQVGNRDILQDMTDAQTSVRGYSISHRKADLAPYERASGWLPTDQQKLRALTASDPVLRRAVEAQARAIHTWFEIYAEPLVGSRLFRTDAGALHGRATARFNDFRSANWQLQGAIDQATDQLQQRMKIILALALLVVVLVPLLAVLAVCWVARQLSRSVVEPLTELSAVLERLRAGETDARASVGGPTEVRRIAAELNLLTAESMRASEVEADVLTQLETIDRVRTDLVSTVSHELRTPLTSVNGYVELLQDELFEQLTPQQSTMLGAIRRNLDRLNELIGNLLALSRAEETQLVLEPIDLREIAVDVATDLRLQAGSRDVSIKVVPASAPVVVLGDRSQLIRAVQNLVTNAVKFSRPGSAVELRVSGHHEAVIQVVDEGIGIPASDLSALGSRFFRASNAVRAEIAGTGLGLRIVQTILARHDGSLAVDSVEGEGSTFTLRVPLVSSVGSSPLARREPAMGLGGGAGLRD